jgi:ferrous iron transport protein A
MQFRHRHGQQKEDYAQNRTDEVPLTSLNEGMRAIMMHTSGGFGVVRRLSEMGLTPGSEIRLLRKCSFHGPIEIEIRGVSLAIGYGLAEQIFVQPLKAN